MKAGLDVQHDQGCSICAPRATTATSRLAGLDFFREVVERDGSV